MLYLPEILALSLISELYKITKMIGGKCIIIIFFDYSKYRVGFLNICFMIEAG